MPNKPNELLRYAGLATQIFVSLGVAVWAGMYIDKKINATPICSATFPLLILLGIFYKIFKESTKK